MNKKITRTLIAGVAAAGLCFGAMPTTASAQAAAPSEAEANALSVMREEERMAKELYQAFADQYDGARPFANIVNAEQQHFDTLGNLLSNYGIADPSAGRAAGSYAYPEIQALYDGWIAQGSESLQAAYQVGADLEVRDIADLQVAMDATELSALDTAYGRLKNGSENHLTAYQRAIAGELGSGAGQRPKAGQQQGQGAQGQGQGAQRGQGMQAGKQSGKQQGPRTGMQDGSGIGRQDGTGPRAASGDCPRVA